MSKKPTPSKKAIAKVKQSKSFKELAVKTWDVAVNCLFLSRKNLMAFAGAMKLIRDKELYTYRDYSSFEEACCSPEISIKPKTIKNYIAIYEYWIEKQKKKMDELAGIEYNKLLLLRKVKNPEKYYHEARTLGYSDFRKVIMQKEFKLQPDDEQDMKDHFKRKHPCPHWTGEKCLQGIPVDEPKAPGKGKKNRELI